MFLRYRSSRYTLWHAGPKIPLRTNGFRAGGLLLLTVWSATLLTTQNRRTLHLDHEEPRVHRIGKSELPDVSKPDAKVNINGILRRHEQSCFPEKGTGIARYDVAQYASNNPIEDAHAEAILPVPSGHWSFFAVLDGHSGWETSTCLRENLIPATSGALADLYSRLNPHTPHADIPVLPSPDELDRTIRDAFKRLDDDIVHWAVDRVFASESRAAAVNLLGPAYAGACALLAFYDAYSCVLRIALTGDSRAVLGRRGTNKNGEPVYEVHVLSVEQDGRSLAEEFRLNAEHPGEAVVQNGRVLGMGPSRAFGDALYKWSLDVQWKLKREYLGRTPRPFIKTPPYFTAEPEVTQIEVRPGDFLILATDGLWESLTSSEAVGLVGLWSEHGYGHNGPSKTGEHRTLAVQELPVELSEDENDESVRYRQWGAKKQFVILDENAATHLLRNALGGADEDLASAIISMRAPRSRTYIDDITATVVFFE